VKRYQGLIGEAPSSSDGPGDFLMPPLKDLWSTGYRCGARERCGYSNLQSEAASCASCATKKNPEASPILPRNAIQHNGSAD
jgi:hypothetical protein